MTSTTHLEQPEGLRSATGPRRSVSSEAARAAAIAESAIESLRESLQTTQADNAALRQALIDNETQATSRFATLTNALEAQAALISSLREALSSCQDGLAQARQEITTLGKSFEGHTHSTRHPGKYWAGDTRSTGPLPPSEQVPSHY